MLVTLKIARKPVKLQRISPAGCAGEGKQSKGNEDKKKERFKDNRQPLFVRKRVCRSL